MEEEKIGIRKEISELKELLEDNKKNKVRKFRLPFNAKVGKASLKKDFITVEIINENKEIGFKKVQIIDGTYTLGDTFHAIKSGEIFTYKGKPFVHQAKNKLNAWNPLSDKHETYGQKYIMARMKSDFIKGKKKMGWGVTAIIIVIGGIIAYSFLTGG